MRALVFVLLAACGAAGGDPLRQCSSDWPAEDGQHMRVCRVLGESVGGVSFCCEYVETHERLGECRGSYDDAKLECQRGKL